MVTTARWAALGLVLGLLGGCGVEGPVGLITPGPGGSARGARSGAGPSGGAASQPAPSTALLLGRVHTPRTQGLSPVDGATLLLRHLASGAEVRVRSEADGSFRAAVPAGALELRVRAPGHLATALRVSAPRAEVDVEMLRVRERGGRVTGALAARALVEIAGGIPTWRRELRADAQGRFVLRAPPGLYEVVARSAPGASKPLASTIHAGVRIGGAREAGQRASAPARTLTLELEPAARLSGVVLLGDKPVAGATVVLMPAHPSSLRWRRTSDERGRFSFPALRHGKYRLETIAEGLLPDVGRSVSLPLEAPLRVALERGRSVSGVVQDGQARALAGAMVRAEISRAMGEGGARFAGAGELGVTLGIIPPIPAADTDGSTATAGGGGRDRAVLGAWTSLSDASGRFELRGLPARKLRLVASLDGYGVARSAWIDGAATRSAPLLTLTRGATVAGVVVDERGLPLSGARVSLLASTLSTSASGDSADVTRSLLTSADGRFEARGMLSGERRVVVSVRARGYLPLRQTVDGASAASLRLSLTRAEGQVSGLVVDQRGLPLDDATVLARIGGVTLSARSSAAGRFMLEGVGKHPLVIEARKAGHSPARQRVRPGARAVMMRLERLQSLELLLVDHRTGAQIQRARVGIDGEPARYVTISRDRGAMALQAARGRRAVLIRATGYAEKTVRLRVDEGPQPTRARVELHAAGRVSGVVRDSAGQPVGGARVGVGARSVVSAADGSFELGGVPEGNHTLQVEHGDARERVSVSVQANQLTGPLRIHLSPAN